MAMMIAQTLFAQTDVRFQSFISSQAATLGDIVEFIPEHPIWAKRPLDSHPHAGDVLDHKSVLTWLENKTLDKHLRWLGKHKAEVHGDIRTSGKELAALAKHHLLKALLDLNVLEVELQELNFVPDSEQPIQAFRTEVSLRDPLPKRIGVWLKADKEQHPVWFKVKTLAKVWVAKQPLKSNQFLKAEDFSETLQDIAGLKGQPVKSFPAHYLLVHGMKKDEVLIKQLIAPIPTVQKGQLVTVTLKQEGVTLHVQALAESNGTTGEVIPLKNLSSNQSFFARVTAHQQAEVAS